jgi:hypothetical protein
MSVVEFATNGEFGSLAMKMQHDEYLSSCMYEFR